MIRILFLSANPIDTQRLRLDEEVRAIDHALQQTTYFEIKTHWAVRLSDLQELLLRHKPTIVHFSGHGSPAAEIILQDENGNGHPVPGQLLKQLFALLKDDIKCVVLNACYSQIQSESIADEIDCVIGMPNQIDDKAAIKFAAAFYQALGYGKNLKAAYELGSIQIGLEKLSDEDKPRLIAKNINAAEVRFTDNLDRASKPAASTLKHSSDHFKQTTAIHRFSKSLGNSAWGGVASITGIAALALTLIIWVFPSPASLFQPVSTTTATVAMYPLIEAGTRVEVAQVTTPIQTIVAVTDSVVNAEPPKAIPPLTTTEALSITLDASFLPDNRQTLDNSNPCLTNIRSPTGSSVQVLEVDGSRTSGIIADKQEVIVTGRNDTDRGIIFGVTELDGHEIGWIRDYNLANVSINCPYHK